MGFGEAIKTCFSKYFTISGRARRSEYWYFYLFTFILGIVAGIIDVALGLGGDIGLLGTIASLATFIPTITAQVRRLHDTGRSGWWVGGALIAFIVFGVVIGATFGAIGVEDPSDMFAGTVGVLFIVFAIAVLIYAITMLVFMCLDSEPGTNKYGPSPKYDTGATVFD